MAKEIPVYLFVGFLESALLPPFVHHCTRNISSALNQYGQQLYPKPVLLTLLWQIIIQ